jgi:hypothetical protein
MEVTLMTRKRQFWKSGLTKPTARWRTSKRRWRTWRQC